MAIKEASITHIDFSKINPETLFAFLELFGFTRHCHNHWLVPSKTKDPRYPDDYVSEAEEGPYPMVIIPYYHLNKRVFIIDEEHYEKIKAYFLRSLENGRS